MVKEHNSEQETTLKEVVKGEVRDQFAGMDMQINSVNSKLDEVKSMTMAERERESRAANIIMYNVKESTVEGLENRWIDDRSFCMDLFNKVLGIPVSENDIKRFVRLGKRDPTSIASGKSRPILIQFRDRVIKNMIMESLSKLKNADDNYKRIIFTHDMIKEDRDDYKKLVEEAKKSQEENTSGEYIYRVKGTPGKFVLLKIRRRY